MVSRAGSHVPFCDQPGGVLIAMSQFLFPGVQIQLPGIQWQFKGFVLLNKKLGSILSGCPGVAV